MASAFVHHAHRPGRAAPLAPDRYRGAVASHGGPVAVQRGCGTPREREAKSATPLLLRGDRIIEVDKITKTSSGRVVGCCRADEVTQSFAWPNSAMQAPLDLVS